MKPATYIVDGESYNSRGDPKCWITPSFMLPTRIRNCPCEVHALEDLYIAAERFVDISYFQAGHGVIPPDDSPAPFRRRAIIDLAFMQVRNVIPLPPPRLIRGRSNGPRICTRSA